MLVRILSLEESILEELGEEKIRKIKKMFLKNYCTYFMILLVMVCVTLISTNWSHNFPFLFRVKDISLFVDIYFNKQG